MVANIGLGGSGGPRCFFGALANQLLTAADIDHQVSFELPTITQFQLHQPAVVSS